MFLEEMSCRRYKKKECKEQKEYHSYKIGTWDIRTLNQGGKLENLKTEMQKNEVFVLSVSEVWWKGQGEIRSGDYAVYYSGGEWAERSVAIVVHKSIVRSVVKKIVCNDRIIALNLKVELVSILIMQVYMPTSEYEGDEVEKSYDTIEEILEEDGKGNTNNITLGDWNSIVGDESYQKSKKWTDCHQHIVQEAKKKTVHMEGTWRLESTLVGLHPCEASIQKQCEGCADTAWGRY